MPRYTAVEKMILVTRLKLGNFYFKRLRKICVQEEKLLLSLFQKMKKLFDSNLPVQ